MQTLNLHNILYSRANFTLKGITFKLTDSITCLVGESGSGKSTILKLIAGLEEPDSGTISINGKIVFDDEENINVLPEHRNTALIFQHFSLFPNKSVFENIKFAVSDSKNADKVALEMLRLVEMEKHANFSPSNLSGGQQQLITLARAFAQNPSLILLDEPFSNLDAILRAKTRAKIISLIKKQNLTALIVTHDAQEALEIADKIIVIRNGEVIMDDTSYNIYNRPTDVRTAQLFGEINKIEGEIIDGVFHSDFGKIKLSGRVSYANKLYARPEAIKLSDDENSVNAIVQKIFMFSKMVKIKIDNNYYWMKYLIDDLPKKYDTIRVKLDSSYLISFDLEA